MFPGLKCAHQMVTLECRFNRGPNEAFSEAVNRLFTAYKDLLPREANEDATYHLILTVERPNDSSGRAVVVENRAAEVVAFRCRRTGSKFDWTYVDHRAPDSFELRECEIQSLYASPPPAADHTALLKRADEWLADASGWLDDHTGGMLHGAADIIRDLRDSLRGGKQP